MKVKDVPQDSENSYYAGHQRACYAVDENGRYKMVGSLGWDADSICNGQANEEVRAQIADALARARRDEISTLAYHMARRQMTIGLLSSYSGISRVRIWWHLRPSVFAQLPDKILHRYAEALQIPSADLRTLPRENAHERL